MVVTFRRQLLNCRAVFALGAVLLALCLPANAQQSGKIGKIGVLVSTSRAQNTSREDNLWQGLRQLGYIDGKNVALEYRYADGQLDRLPSLRPSS